MVNTKQKAKEHVDMWKQDLIHLSQFGNKGKFTQGKQLEWNLSGPYGFDYGKVGKIWSDGQ